MQLGHEGLPHLSRPVDPAIPQFAALGPTHGLCRGKHVLSALVHLRQDLLLLEVFDLVFGQGILHATYGVLHASQLVDLLGDELSVLVEVFLRV